MEQILAELKAKAEELEAEAAKLAEGATAEVKAEVEALITKLEDILSSL